MPFQLYDYQNKLLSDARQSLANGSKSVMVVSAAGSGKTAMMSEMARLTTSHHKRVWVMAHRKELINQIRDSFKFNEVDFEYAVIKTVGTMVHRMNNMAPPDLIIFDEAHHSIANTYRKVRDKFPNVPTIGFTATPWRMSGVGFTDMYDDIVTGPSIPWLIEHDKLAPFDYYVPTFIDINKIKFNSAGNATADSMQEAVGDELATLNSIYDQWKLLAEHEKTITYMYSVDSSHAIVDLFNQNGVPSAHIDSKTPKAIRDKAMQDFKDGKLQMLSNYELYGEGVNIPDATTVIMARPTKSLVFYIQAGMRSMRYQPNKKALILDFVGNVNRFGLPDYDHDWEDYFKGTKKKKSGDFEAPVSTCDNCFATFYSNEWVDVHSGTNEDGKETKYKTCPYCGEVTETVVERAEKKAVDIKLSKVTDLDEFEKNRLAGLSVRQAKTPMQKYKILQSRYELKLREKDGYFATIFMTPDWKEDWYEPFAELSGKSIEQVKANIKWAHNQKSLERNNKLDDLKIF
ncbi:DEAD/DEAH box helicase family protein [Leuconostoc suionicum]|uniref:DEAD/DEAH box helicase family protein n=1 Tax=Leuconostoc suionicum TaxID=1511761 RepID=UPI0024AD8042|nr:DEAD/DEAH box helicase family protein [Leuconostoc suionicum]MDI6497902.1 DEAD/DEAH box helicase family protein [Leuconostoc suionicum]MDI6499983.1 DEAD/DEAH box helicase family protein [Leuconostoc suionicum]MDI6502920.1 DEAD/DEAH box helicase family protein [Leuconostoc suionicum]MDI6665779.1 DEAD/DEAH box helicase family protein [Leuconostoc suionicum]